MQKKIFKTIGLMGAVINNVNLGCVALTISLLCLLEEVAKECNYTFEYYIYEDKYDDDKTKWVAETLGIPLDKLHSIPNYYCELDSVESIARTLYHFSRNLRCILSIKKCDCVIDLTQGDSFSDIYGLKRFYLWSKNKEIVIKKHVPLILGPQTYGPFISSKARDKAKHIIEKSAMVIARDIESAEYIAGFSSKDVVIGTDLAFHLPYNKLKLSGNKIKIGINPSGLLLNNKIESTKFDIELKTNYDDYIYAVINYLVELENYEVHIIPHVGDEAYAINLSDERLIIHPGFSNPIDAKNLISSMDVFIGARMHATIAAISSGVPVIPVAYSKKFAGVFGNICYDNVVDLRFLTTDEAVNKTIELILRYKDLQIEALESMENAEELYSVMKNEIKSFFINTLE